MCVCVCVKDGVFHGHARTYELIKQNEKLLTGIMHACVINPSRYLAWNMI